MIDKKAVLAASKLVTNTNYMTPEGAYLKAKEIIEAYEAAKQRTIKLTERERLTIAFLSNKMEATSAMIGEHINKGLNGRDWRASYVGGSIVSKLRKKGIVMHIPELNAWRLTKEGRDLICK